MRLDLRTSPRRGGVYRADSLQARAEWLPILGPAAYAVGLLLHDLATAAIDGIPAEKLAVICGVAPGKLQRALDRLATFGLLHTEPVGHGGTRIYIRVRWPQPGARNLQRTLRRFEEASSPPAALPMVTP